MSRMALGAIALGVVLSSEAGTLANAPVLAATPFDGGRFVTARGTASSALAPDGNAIYMMQPAGSGWTITVAQRSGGAWSVPTPAPFSGEWRDLDPAIAPDGRTLVFASNRPATAGGPAIDSLFGRNRQRGQGMNLWRVTRRGTEWSPPVRLPAAINACPMTFAPTVAANGDLFYIGCLGTGRSVQLLGAALEGAGYGAPHAVRLGAPGETIRDPAIAPDQSFIVVSVRSGPGKPYRLAIAFREAGGWGSLTDLGDTVNGDATGVAATAMGSQIARDGRLLLFYSDRALPAGFTQPGAAQTTQLWAVALDGLRPKGIATRPATTTCASTPWGLAYDSSPTFSPDGRHVVFMRGRALERRLYESWRQGRDWTPPRRVPFSKAWMDIEPAMAPNGRSLVFASNRPLVDGGVALDTEYGGLPQPGRGGRLWRVEWSAAGWGIPHPVGDAVNQGTATYAPSVAADGSLYFMRAEPSSGEFRLYRSIAKARVLAVAAPLPFSDGVTADYDPTVLPDQSAVVFTSDRHGAEGAPGRLFVAYRRKAGWTTPVPLPWTGTEARWVAPSTLYFSGADHCVQRVSWSPKPESNG